MMRHECYGGQKQPKCERQIRAGCHPGIRKNTLPFGMSWLLNKLRGRRRIGLSLSGGGMRGFGHMGVIQALEEHGYRPDAIAGSSAGAIVGALYAAGHSPQAILEIADKSNLFPATAFRLRTTGFLDTRFLSDIFRKYIPENSFEALQLPLYVATTNINTGQVSYLSQGPLDIALLASSSVPLVFSPVQRDDGPYYDGGILDNLPIEPLRRRCNMLIGVNVNALDDVSGAEMTPMKTIDRIVHLALSQSVRQHAKRCDLFIEPPGMLQFGMFDKKKQREIYQYAYEYASAYLATRVG